MASRRSSKSSVRSQGTQPRASMARRLLRQKSLWLGGALLGGLVGLAWYGLTPARQTAVTQITVTPPKGLTATDTAMQRTFADDVISTFAQRNKFVSDEMRLIRSPAVLNVASSIGDFANLRIFSGVELPASEISTRLVTVPQGKETILVAFSAPDPDEAKIVVKSIAQAYQHYHAGANRDGFDQMIKSLSQQQAVIREKIEQQTAHLNELRHGTERAKELFSDAAGRALDRLVAVSEDLGRVREQVIIVGDLFDLGAIYAGLDPVVANRQDSIKHQSTVLDEVDATNAAVELSKARSAFEAHRENTERLLRARRSAPKGEQGITAEQIQLAEAELRLLGQRLMSAAAKQRMALKRQQARLSLEFDSAQTAATLLSPVAKRIASLASERSASQAQLERINQQIDAVRVTAQAGSPVVTVSGQAQTDHPQFLPWPRLNPLVWGGLGLGLLCGLTLAGYRVLSDKDGFVSGEKVTSRLRLRTLHSSAARAVETRNGARTGVAMQGRSWIERNRAIVAGLSVYVNDQARLPATMLVTSPTAGEGAAQVASELAIYLSREGLRVILVDLNFAAPTVHDQFASVAGASGLNPSVGLSQVLEGRPLVSVVQPSGIAHLDLICSGPLPADSASLLNSDRLVQMINELTDAYDHVVVSAPPTNAGDDARIVASAIDSTILSIDPGPPADVKAIEKAHHDLVMLGANIAGVVLRDRTNQGKASLELPLVSLVQAKRAQVNQTTAKQSKEPTVALGSNGVRTRVRESVDPSPAGSPRALPKRPATSDDSTIQTHPTKSPAGIPPAQAQSSAVEQPLDRLFSTGQAPTAKARPGILAVDSGPAPAGDGAAS